MTNDAARIASAVEQAELTSNNPAKAGLAKLQEQYNQLTGTPRSKDHIIADAIDQLHNDGALDAIVDAWGRAAISSGEKLTARLQVYKDPDKDPIRTLSAGYGLDKQLGSYFYDKMENHGQSGDTVIGSRRLFPGQAISDTGLDKLIAADDRSIVQQQVAEQLKTVGPKGPLWKTLIGLADAGKITEQTLDRAYAQRQQLSLSPAEEQALTQLKAEWNSDTGVKPFRIDTTTRFVTGNPLNGLNPLYGLNPINHLSPFNHDETSSKAIDYLGPTQVDDLLNRAFNGSQRVPCDNNLGCWPAEDLLRRR